MLAGFVLAAAADAAVAQRLAGEPLKAVAIAQFFDWLAAAERGHAQQLAAQGELGLPVAVGEQTVWVVSTGLRCRGAYLATIGHWMECHTPARDG